jgi:RHS repeat-associated protein
MKYTGEYLDPTGLYHLRARQYDPTVGLFLARDPIQPATDSPYMSSYAYVDGRPTVLTDPSGLCWTGFCWGKHLAQWAEHHPDVVVVAAAAAGCIAGTAGICTPLAFAAAATTVRASADRNLRGSNRNYCGFGTDLAIIGATFGVGALWSSVARNSYFVRSAGDSAALDRLGAAMFYGIDFIARG